MAEVDVTTEVVIACPRDIVGSAGEVPKVACPLHKKPFSLETGECLSDEEFALKVFPVKVEHENVFIQLPPKEQLDALLATELHCIRGCNNNRHGTCEPALASLNC
jgi:hypothetical protein